jgi:hypothetical protein
VTGQHVRERAASFGAACITQLRQDSGQYGRQARIALDQPILVKGKHIQRTEVRLGFGQKQLLNRVDLGKGCGITSGVYEHAVMARGIYREAEQPVSVVLSGEQSAVGPK